jgi:hypothetical protein
LRLFKGSFELELVFELFSIFSLVCRFLCHLLVLRFLLLLDDLLELLFGFFVLQLCFMCLGFKIETLCFCVVNVLIKEEIEKLNGQYIDLICHE